MGKKPYEIRNFELNISYGQYWISYEKNDEEDCVPVILSPYKLYRKNIC